MKLQRELLLCCGKNQPEIPLSSPLSIVIYDNARTIQHCVALFLFVNNTDSIYPEYKYVFMIVTS